jgi:AraC family transcriptional activator of pobA
VKKKNSQPLPVYNIETFRNANSKSSFFDIKILEQHDREREEIHRPHRHDCYLILIATQGTGSHFIDFSTYEIKPYTAFLLTPGQVHSWKLASDIQGFVLFFTSSFYLMHRQEKHLTDVPFLPTSGVQLNDQKEASLIVLLNEMTRENSQNESGRDEFLRSSLEILLIRLSRYHSQKARASTSIVTLQVSQLQSLIEKYFINWKSVGHYADYMNITPKHLNDVCKKALNKTVSDLIHERQLLEVKRLLAYTNTTTKAIADHLAFNDKSYLNRFFKKYTGFTPEQFRESEQKVQHQP